MPGVLMEIDVDRAQIRSQTPIPNATGGFNGLAASPDGRFLIWTTSFAGTAGAYVDTLNLFDRQTKTSTEVLRVPSADGPTASLIAHPTKFRAFGGLGSTPAFAIDPAGVMVFEGGGGYQEIEGLTADGAVMLISRAPASLVLVNSDTGAEAGALTPAPFIRAAVSPDAAFLYTAGPQWAYKRLDPSTGAVLAERTVPGDGYPSKLRVDPLAGNLFVQVSDGPVQVLDGETLEPLTLLKQPFLPPPQQSPEPFPDIWTGYLAFDAQRPRAYLLSMRPKDSHYDSAVAIVDTNTLKIIGGAQLPITNRATGIVVMPRAPQPTGLDATVQDHRVTLQWTNGAGPGAVTGFRIEAGSASGLENLAVIDTTVSPTLVIDGVPSGTYYVRVRGMNFEGGSDPSNEIVVQVP
jgi:hypothetical protein